MEKSVNSSEDRFDKISADFILFSMEGIPDRVYFGHNMAAVNTRMFFVTIMPELPLCLYAFASNRDGTVWDSDGMIARIWFPEED